MKTMTNSLEKLLIVLSEKMQKKKTIKKSMCIAIIMTRQRLTLIQYYCVISVQMGSYFWSVFSCI